MRKRPCRRHSPTSTTSRLRRRTSRPPSFHRRDVPGRKQRRKAGVERDRALHGTVLEAAVVDLNGPCAAGAQVGEGSVLREGDAAELGAAGGEEGGMSVGEMEEGGQVTVDRLLGSCLRLLMDC